MVIIRERGGKFLNFFTASIVVGLGGVLLSFLSILILFIILVSNLYLTSDYVTLNLSITFVSQLIGACIVYYILIPLFKTKNVEHRPITIINLLRTITLICGTFTFVFSSNIILSYIFKILNMKPQSAYTNILLTSENLANPLKILIYYLPITIGAAIYEELIYRRLLIPLLEQRGMSPLVATLSSSLLFAIAHLPNDLVNANLSGTIMHISAVFLIGVSLGLIYILTRNVFFSIMIHGILNFISFSGPLVTLIANNLLTLIYITIVWAIYIIGFVIILYGVYQFFRKKDIEWVMLIKEKSSNPIIFGFFGSFLIVAFIIFLPLIIQVIITSLEIAFYDILLYLIFLITSYGTTIILFLWLGNRTKYESKSNLKDLLYISYKKKIKN